MEAIAELDHQPLYRRIAGELRAKIQAGELGVGDQVPTEEELCGQYGVSRMTVRQALGELVRNGLVVRRRGRGSFVSSDKIERSSGRLLGFHEDAQSRGLHPATEVLDQRWTPASREDAVLLELEDSDHVYQVRRLRYADDEPVGLNFILLVPQVEAAFRGADYTQSFYRLLQERSGTEVEFARQRVEAVSASAELAALLGIAPGSSLLEVTRVTFLSGGRLAGLTRTFYRGDRYYLSLTVDRVSLREGGEAAAVHLD